MKLFPLVLASLFYSVIAQPGAVDPTVDPPVVPETTPVEYMHDGTDLLGHLAVPDGEGPFPAIIIIPDSDGVNEYEQARATMIAQEWGFVAFAADIFGADFQYVDFLSDRAYLADEYLSDPDLFAGRINTAVELVKRLNLVDEENVALFGYSFGGTGVLQYALYGNDVNVNVTAIASFHGALTYLPEVPAPFGPKLLVQSAGDDDTSTSIMKLEKTLDEAEAHWEITRYSGVINGFTDFFQEDAYNQYADMKSWEAAYNFVLEAFGIIEFEAFEFNGLGDDDKPEATSVVAVDYNGTDGAQLRGYLAMPEDTWERPLPAVVIIPDWDGVNAYEQDRAAALAELGYVAFAADIFGVDKQEGLNETERIELTGIYFSDPDLFIARMQSAIDQVKMLDSDVATDEIAIIGYCFGGSGVVLYSLQSGVDAKVAVAFHGALSAMPEVLVTPIQPYLLVLSGGDDPLHGNQTTMEGAFNGGEANWEITRYAGVQHGYTVPGQEAYNLNADVRSWESMLSSFEELLALPHIAATPTPSGVPTASSPPSESPTIATPAPTGFPTTSSSPSASPTIATPAPSLFPTETVPTTPSPTASAPPTSSPSSAPLPTEDTSTPKTLAPTSTKTLAPTSGAFSRFGYFVAFAIATAAFVIV